MVHDSHSSIEFSRFSLQHTTLVSDLSTSASGVVFAFTERSGGVSQSPYDSLNLARHVEDKEDDAYTNRQILLNDLGISYYQKERRLLVPSQIHSDIVIEVKKTPDEALYASLLKGADAIVCNQPGYAAMLMYADCVPIVLITHKAFAVIHSGWKGTFAHISVKALKKLCKLAVVSPEDVRCYIGPHIDVKNYEVSIELISKFTHEFGVDVAEGRHLSLSRAIQKDLLEAGIRKDHISDCHLSTVDQSDRFFSYRKSGGSCGRHGAIAFLGTDLQELPSFKLLETIGA